MLQRLLEAIRKLVSKIFGYKDVQNALSLEIQLTDKMTTSIELWQKMYLNKAPWIKKKAKSLNLSACIASELARLTTVELKTEITGSERADFLNECYQKFIDNLRIQLEYALAKGGIVFRPFISNGKISIDCVQADRFFPVEFNSSEELVSCIFVDEKLVGEKIYTRLEFHKWNNTSIEIINKAYVKQKDETDLGKEIPLALVNEWAEIEPLVTLENPERPLFSYFKVPLANTVDTESNLGISVYAKAVDLIKEADEQFGRIIWEYRGSELAIDVDETCFNAQNKLPEGEDRLFRRLEVESKLGTSFYSVFSPTIRDSSLFNGLNKILQKIEFLCGLAYGTLSEMQETEKTATEIMASKQRSYSTVSDIQSALQTALENLIVSMGQLADLYKLAPKGNYEVSFGWDDSLIVDSATEQAVMLQEVSAGLIKPELYLMKRYGVTEEQAKEMMPNINVEEDEDINDME